VADLSLSADQQRAIDSEAHALVVVAGAGSGKTEVLARRIERLLLDSEAEDYRILAVSFTVKVDFTGVSTPTPSTGLLSRYFVNTALGSGCQSSPKSLFATRIGPICFSPGSQIRGGQHQPTLRRPSLTSTWRGRVVRPPRS
jgi:hypothetical protein